jgi:hypothetical protein
MTDSAANETAPDAPAPAMNEEQALAQLRARQNFALAVPAGIAAAVVGAILWAVFVYATNMELGLVAIAVGALVGYAVRTAGHGIDAKFGVLGAVCAAFGWALGTILCDIGFVAKEAGRPFLDVAATLGVGQSVSLALQAGDAMELLFLAIAVWEGWKLARHNIRRPA